MSRWARSLVAIAALMGAAGVIESAMAAHGHPDTRLATAAQFLMLDAAAAIAICSFGLHAPRPRCFLIAASMLLAGGFLFAADLTVRGFGGDRLFFFAAPIGGTLTIIGWVAAAIATIFQSSRKS